MITDKLTRSKNIRDPLFSSMLIYMRDRISELTAAGQTDKVKLAMQRYSNLSNEDVQIEPPAKFANGKELVCFLSRKTGFFHADTPIAGVTVDLIYRDLRVTVPEFTKAQLITEIKGLRVTRGVYYLTDASQMVVVLGAEDTTAEAAYKALGEIFWDKTTIDLLPNKDPSTSFSGTVMVEAPNISPYTFQVMYVPHILAEAKAKKK